MSAQVQWKLSGDYFENCNCRVVCPCLVSTAAPLNSRPTEGICDAALVFHVENGTYDGLSLDDLNVALIARIPGPMADGNWTIAAYIDTRANDRQAEALEAIFSGSAGGPMAAFAPLIGTSLGTKKVPIAYAIDGKTRSVRIPDIMQMSVEPLPSLRGNEEIWAATGHPANPDKLAFAAGSPGSTFRDYGMQWDNSGRNGHYAPISWSNP
ncbi:MAG: DUF1326 domain-containing protein [Rhodospirillales bacterium]|nr:DUF1326 domain-containing protein [Rhodospirillales bacterium]